MKKIEGLALVAAITTATLCTSYAKVFKATGKQPLEVWLPKASKNVSYLKKASDKKQHKKSNTGLKFRNKKGAQNQAQILRVTADGIKQSTVVLSAGSDINQLDGFPTGYANYHQNTTQQFLIRASELHEAGFTGSSSIDALSFYVEHPTKIFFKYYKGIGTYTISIGHSMQSELQSEERNLTQVHTVKDFIEQPHWNRHEFSQPFYWDGYRNIIVEVTCSADKHSANASVQQSSTPFSSSLLRLAGNTSISTSKQRPTIRLSLAGNAHEPLVITRGALDTENNNFYGVSNKGHILLWEDDTWNEIPSKVVGHIRDIVLLSTGALCALTSTNELFIKAAPTAPWHKHKAHKAPVTLAKIGKGHDSDVILGLDESHQNMYQLEAQGWKHIVGF